MVLVNFGSDHLYRMLDSWVSVVQMDGPFNERTTKYRLLRLAAIEYIEIVWAF